MTKVKKSISKKKQNPKLWQTSKKQFVTKFFNLNVTKLKKINFSQTKKTQIMTKLKKLKSWQNYKKKNCDKTQKLNLWGEEKTKKTRNCEKKKTLKK